MSELQYLRQARLTVVGAGAEMDLSAMRFRFSIKAAEVESPNNASIRIYNLSKDTATTIKKEFREVTLEAGYSGRSGVIFKGTIKWFREGREGSTDAYLDLLAADGDVAYNQAMINMTIEAGTTSRERIAIVAATMEEKGLSKSQIFMAETGGILPRGKVKFGMSRVNMRKEVEAAGGTWSIQQGQIVALPKDGYVPGQAIILNGQSGLIGRVEQTVDGVKAKCLINPDIKVGQLVKIDNASINKDFQADAGGSPVPYDQYRGIRNVANVTTDGLYRVYVIEYEGDTRGREWYSDLILLAVDPAENLVVME